MKASPTIFAFSHRAYRLLLHLYPTPFRRTFGVEMSQVFRDDVRGTLQAGGRAAVIGLWLETLFDLLKTAAAEHVWEVFHMPIEKFDRWTGLAAAVGGALFVYVFFFDLPIDRLPWMLPPIFFLWAVALTGLYRRLPATSSSLNKIAFGLGVISLLILIVGAFSFWQSNPDLPWYMLGAGLFGLALSIIGMGMISLASPMMGVWRLVPLVLGGVFLFFMIVSTIPTAPRQLWLTLLFLNGISWLLLAFALWQTGGEPTEPGLLA